MMMYRWAGIIDCSDYVIKTGLVDNGYMQIMMDKYG